MDDSPRFAVVSPYAATWLLRVLARAGVDSGRVRAEAAGRRSRGYEGAAADLEAGWRQLQAAARWHADLIAGGAAEPAAPPADPVVSVGGSTGAETGGAVAPFGVSSVAVGRPVQVVAVRLGVTPRRVRQLIASGALVAERVGRSWLIESASVDDYEAHRLTKGNRSA